jgi:hypothetical protein
MFSGGGRQRYDEIHRLASLLILALRQTPSQSNGGQSAPEAAFYRSLRGDSVDPHGQRTGGPSCCIDQRMDVPGSAFQPTHLQRFGARRRPMTAFVSPQFTELQR